MDFLKQPIARDTTPNSAAEIFARLATVVRIAGATVGPVLALAGLAQKSIGLLVAGGVLGAAGLILHFTRDRWDPTKKAANKVAPAAPVGGEPAAAATAPAREGGAARRPRVLLLNASAAGAAGNSARLLAKLRGQLASRAELTEAVLAGEGATDFAALTPALREADALVVATGTHWDAWSSPLQKFLEDATPSEATALWMGKPAAVVVSEHSTGGKGVLSRLQGVLSTFGCVIPPMSGVVISRSGQMARRHAPAEAEDFWCAEDLAVVAHNLTEAAARPRAGWRAWPVDRENFSATWVE